MTKKKELSEAEKAIIDVASCLDKLLKRSASINLEASETPVELIVWYHSLEKQVAAVNAAVSKFTIPANELVQKIKGKLLEILNEGQVESIKTTEGTVYKSYIMSPKIEDQDKFLDFVLDNWDDCGKELMSLSAPKVEALRNYMQMNDGQLPPGIKTSTMVRLNIRST